MEDLLSCNAELKNLYAMLQQSTGNIQLFETRETVSKNQLLKLIYICDEKLGAHRNVVLHIPNSLEWVIICLTALFTGRRVVAVDATADLADYDNRLQNPEEYLTISDLTEAKKRISGETGELIDDSEKRQIRPGKLILFTTGTTGRPKGVCIQITNIFYNLKDLQNYFQLEKKDDFLMATPFSHAMGFIMMMMGVFCGGNVVIPQNLSNVPNAFLSNKVDIMAIPPIQLKIFSLSNVFLEKIRNMKFMICGSAGMDYRDYMDYHQQGICVLNGYGMTECVSAIGVTRYSAADGTGLLDVLPSCEVMLGEENEIMVRGKSVCTTYLDGTGIVDEDGWYHTKDIGQWVNHRLQVLYRKDMVVVLDNGYKVNLKHIEDMVNRLEMVLDCQVFVVKKSWQSIEVNVVLKDECQDYPAADLKEAINASLEYFEKVSDVKICRELETKGGKKTYGYQK